MTTEPTPIPTPTPIRDLEVRPGSTIRLVERYPDPKDVMQVVEINHVYVAGALRHIALLAYLGESVEIGHYTLVPDEPAILMV